MGGRGGGGDMGGAMDLWWRARMGRLGSARGEIPPDCLAYVLCWLRRFFDECLFVSGAGEEQSAGSGWWPGPSGAR